MIQCQCNYFSKALKNHVTVNVLLPSMNEVECLFKDYKDIYPKNPKFKTLYLLHGALDDCNAWMRQTSVERYFEGSDIAIVMPSGQNSFYTDAKSGMDYFTFLTEELPAFVRHIFPLSDKREDNFIAGPSMGGYGAAKCALRCPHKYAAFGCFSGAVDPGELEPLMVGMGLDFFRYDLIFGGADKVAGTPDDPFYLAKGLKEATVKPSAFVTCGLEDANNYGMGKRFYETLKENGFDVQFTDGRGEHDFAYWDGCVKLFGDYIKAF